jgi:DNA repair exonuclease SbcCD ATPase subunit
MPKLMRNQKSNLNNSVKSIEGSCDKPYITENFVIIRDRYKRLKIEYDKLQVLRDQNKQLIRDNDTKLKNLTSKNKEIKQLENDKKELHLNMKNETTKSCKLEKELEYMKSHVGSKDDFDRYVSYAKKKDEIINEKNRVIEELTKQINSTKINQIEGYKNNIINLNEQIKHLKEGYGKFNLDEDEKLSEELEKSKAQNEIFKTEIQKSKEQNEKLSEELEESKAQNELFIKTIKEYQKYSTQMFDIPSPF